MNPIPTNKGFQPITAGVTGRQSGDDQSGMGRVAKKDNSAQQEYNSGLEIFYKEKRQNPTEA